MMSAPLARTSSGFIALTVAAVPTGMNAGVRISPRAMAIVPVRAAPSVAVDGEGEAGHRFALLAAPARARYSRADDRSGRSIPPSPPSPS